MHNNNNNYQMGHCQSSRNSFRKNSHQESTCTNPIVQSATTTDKFERRKFRLYSEVIPRGKNQLEPIRSDSNNKEQDNYLQEIQEQHELSATLPKQNNNNHPLQPLQNKKKSLALSRKASIEYCSEFRKNNKMHNKHNLLLHLANNLSRSAQDVPFNELNVNIPEHMIDWEYTVNPHTKVGYWNNKGCVKLTQADIDNIVNLNCESVKQLQHFYQKRIWLYHYIRFEISEKIQTTSHGKQLLFVHRHNILDESFNHFLTRKDIDVRSDIQIHFIDETAHDAGGTQREWYDCIYREIFKEEKQLFIEDPNDAIVDGTYVLYPMSQQKVNCDLFYFIGCLLAKTIIDKANVTEKLNPTILKQIINEPLTLDDLKYYDTDIHSSLLSIQTITDDEQLKEFSFIWNTSNEGNAYEEVELIPNGKNIALKQENKSLFIEKAITFILYEQYKKQIDNIKKGFYTVIPPNIINAFNKDELDFLLSGQRSVDIKDWQRNTIYRGKYIDGESNKTIQMFWEVLGELSESELVNFYRFCTGTCKVPIDGFAALKGANNKIHKFCIEEADDDDEHRGAKGIRLIEARTCFNRIYLPDYNNKATMKRGIEIILGNDTNYFGLE